jgi:KAP family P-loop domain
MQDRWPVRSLSQVASAFDVQPLQFGDPRYVDITAGRDSDQLAHLRRCLFEYDERDERFAKIAFTGHRGSGKSTELLRLEHDLSDRFTSLHLEAENGLRKDYDYTFFFLWLADELARKFEEDGMPLGTKLVEDVANWFAETALVDVTTVKSQIEVDAEASTQGKAGFYWFSLKMLARLKSMVLGSVERRTEIRQRLQNRADELVDRVNLLLDDARRILKAANKPANMLIVVDNLDRLEPEAIEPLFFRNGDFLKLPRAHLIYTVPIATVVAPNRISQVFEQNFTFPMVKVRAQSGKRFSHGIGALVSLIERRANPHDVFTSKRVIQDLADRSGGSVRDLMRLVQYASRSALTDEKPKIDKASVTEAALTVQQEFERLLIPGDVYYPILARIHLAKRDAFDISNPEQVEAYRKFFSELLLNGSVLEYDGGENWYDVHPLIQNVKAFKKALDDARSSTNFSEPH